MIVAMVEGSRSFEQQWALAGRRGHRTCSMGAGSAGRAGGACCSWAWASMSCRDLNYFVGQIFDITQRGIF